MAKSLRAAPAGVTRRSSVAPLRVSRGAVRAVQASASRPLWFPGNEAPAYLDGSLPGDYGFDPLSLSSDPDSLKWFTHAELINGRWAMLGVAGILFTSIGAKAGLGTPEWFDAGKVAIDTSPIPYGTLVFIELFFFGWVETMRLYDFWSPGSQGQGQFFWITDEFKGNGNGYPGGRFFDPLGLARGTEEQTKQYKLKEIKNGRLAMIAFLGFLAQHEATGKGPIDNLLDHVADPYHVTFATNGVSIPQAPVFYKP